MLSFKFHRSKWEAIITKILQIVEYLTRRYEYFLMRTLTFKLILRSQVSNHVNTVAEYFFDIKVSIFGISQPKCALSHPNAHTRFLFLPHTYLHLCLAIRSMERWNALNSFIFYNKRSKHMKNCRVLMANLKILLDRKRRKKCIFSLLYLLTYSMCFHLIR